MTDERREVGAKLAEMMGLEESEHSWDGCRMWDLPDRFYNFPGEKLLDWDFYGTVLCPWMRERGYACDVHRTRDGAVAVAWIGGPHGDHVDGDYVDDDGDEPLAAAIAALRAEGWET